MGLPIFTRVVPVLWFTIFVRVLSQVLSYFGDSNTSFVLIPLLFSLPYGLCNLNYCTPDLSGLTFRTIELPSSNTSYILVHICYCMIMCSSRPRISPIVKWAGGKARLADTLLGMLPDRFDTYHEPFVGGGSMLFRLIQKQTSLLCYASDMNQELIITYECVRDDLEQLLELLQAHKRAFMDNREEYYYDVRAQNPSNRVEIAARLLFLNKTCFNGLYRVNGRGQFNVPMGSYQNPDIVREKNLRKMSHFLNSCNCSFQAADFETALDYVEPGSFVYLDPPYQPISKNSFTTYTYPDFPYDDLCRLARVCWNLDASGCYVMLSNSCSEKVKQLFSENPWHTTSLKVHRMINSDGSNRTGHCDLLIRNY